MGMRIFWFIIFVVICVGSYFIWDHYHQEKQSADGDYTCQGCMTPEQKAQFDKENSGDTPDGQSEHKEHTAAQDAINVATGGTVGPAAGTSTATSTTAAATAAPAAPAANPGAVTNQPPVAPGSYTLTSSSSTPAATPSSLPVSDSLPANAPDRVGFGGSGKFVWYRQGNITWREDTQTGRSCIAYATMEEWRKPIVISHGCGRDI